MTWNRTLLNGNIIVDHFTRLLLSHIKGMVINEEGWLKIARLKSMRNIFGYGFDVNGNIIEVKEGLSIPEAYNYEFIFKGGTEISILNYNNRKDLRNISFYTLDVNKNIVRMISKGKQGGRIEEYSYCPYPRLGRIKIRQFDESWEEGVTLYHSFQYDVDNKLKSITKTPVTGTYTEIIYMS